MNNNNTNPNEAESIGRKYSMNSQSQHLFRNRILPIAGGMLILAVTGWAVQQSPRSETSPKVNISVNETPLNRDSNPAVSFAPIVKKVAPGVVNISTTKISKEHMNRDLRPFFDDPMLRRFFGEGFEQQSQSRHPRTFKESSLGSGVLVTKDGYIVTNNHVVDGADKIKVTLNVDDKEFDAKVIGRDAKTDIAVLKIEANDLPFLTFADSAKVEVGDVALAVGDPFGVGQTVTRGIVSATGRNGMGIEAFEDFIQTDAAINPGNSGGALVDGYGRLIGINTAIATRSGGSQGVGFAIPSNLVRSVMVQLIKNGHVERGYLGVSIQDVTPSLAQAFDVKGKGALIGGVTPGSAAAEAGLKSGDIVTEFNGKTVRNSHSLQLLVAETAPGSKVPMKVLREGKEKTMEVKLHSMPGQKLAKNENSSDKKAADVLSGVAVGDLDATARAQYELPRNVKGAVVTGVEPGSAAYEAGLREGDVIEQIGHKPVASAEQAMEASSHATGKQTLLRVWSHGGSRYIVVDESQAG